jgi:hypothetical protein
VIFQSGANPVVSRYNTVTGAAGSGDIPTQGSTLIIGTNKIIPDTYDFNPLGNSFKYLRSTTFYANTPIDINALLSASSLATPITGGPTLYQTSFVVPPNSAGDYLYLIWDLRNSSISNLCYSEFGEPEDLFLLCCDCAPCVEECISYQFTNNSREETADVYLPSGLCAIGKEATITLDPEEVVTLCINNAPFYIASGDVSIELIDCGCTGCPSNCQEYIAWANVRQSGTIDYVDCNTGLPRQPSIAPNQGIRVCVSIGDPIYVPIGSVNIDLSSDCGCCPESTCWTWEVINPTAGALFFGYKNCSGVKLDQSVAGNSTLIYCAEAGNIPTYLDENLEFRVTSSCECTL